MNFFAKTSLSLIFTIFSFANLQGQTWVQSQDTLLHGTGGLQKFHLINDTIITYNEFNIYKIPGLNQPWIRINISTIPIQHRIFSNSYQSGDTLFILTLLGNCYRTTDIGNSWEEVTPVGVSFSDSIPTFEKCGDYNFAIFPTSAYYTSNGIQWTYYSPGNELSFRFPDYIIRNDGDSCKMLDTNLQVVNTYSPYFLQNLAFANSSYDKTHYVYHFDEVLNSIFRYDLLQPNPTPQFVGTLQLSSHINVPVDLFSYTINGNMHLMYYNHTSSTGRNKSYYLISSDNGQSWQSRPDLSWMLYWGPINLTRDTILAYDFTNYEYRYSTDNGLSWTPFQHEMAGLIYFNCSYSQTLDTILLHSSPLYAPSELTKGIIRSIDGGQTWTSANNGLPSYLTYYYDTTIYNLGRSRGPYRSGNNYLLYNEDYYQMFHSSDGGTNWVPVNSPPAEVPEIIGTDENDFFALGFNSTPVSFNYYRSRDAGITWIPFAIPERDTLAGGLSVHHTIQGIHDTLLCRFRQENPSQLPIGYYSHRLHISYDDGINWSDITPQQLFNNTNKVFDLGPLFSQKCLVAFGESANKFMIVVAQTDSIFFRWNLSIPTEYHDSLFWFDGTSWSVIQHSGLPADIDIQSLTSFNGIFYLGSNYGVYYSYDNGLNWNSNNFRASNSVMASSPAQGTYQLYKLEASQQRLSLATRNDGIWTQDNLPLSASQHVPNTNQPSLQIFPMPLSAGDDCFWSIKEELGYTQLFITDVTGKIVKTMVYSSISANKTNSISTTQMSAGIYTVTVRSNGFIRSAKLTITNKSN